MSAVVTKVEAIRPHPDPEVTRLDLLDLGNGITLVCGQHYEVGQKGIYISPRTVIPGWLAEDLWMVKKGNASMLVESRIIRGVESPGLFVGEKWQNSRDSAWQDWPLWRKRWVVGEDVSGYLGVIERVEGQRVR